VKTFSRLSKFVRLPVRRAEAISRSSKMVMDSSTSGWSVCRHKLAHLASVGRAKPNAEWMKDIDIPKPGSDDLVLTAQDEKILRRLHIKI
jgi:hypothetical protein